MEELDDCATATAAKRRAKNMTIDETFFSENFNSKHFQTGMESFFYDSRHRQGTSTKMKSLVDPKIDFLAMSQVYSVSTVSLNCGVHSLKASKEHGRCM